MEPQIDSHVVNFINLIKNKYLSTEKESKIMDLAQKSQFFTIDVITDLAMGAPFGNLSSDSDRHDFLRSSMELQPAAIVVASMPWVSKILQTQFVGKFLFPTAQDEIGMGKMIGYANFLVINIDMLNSIELQNSKSRNAMIHRNTLRSLIFFNRSTTTDFLRQKPMRNLFC